MSGHDETQHGRRLPSYVVDLIRRADTLELRVKSLEKENTEQASKSRQDTHHRTLFGPSADKPGVSQNVATLMRMRVILIWLTRVTVGGLVVGAGTLLVKVLTAAAQ